MALALRELRFIPAATVASTLWLLALNRPWSDLALITGAVTTSVLAWVLNFASPAIVRRIIGPDSVSEELAALTYKSVALAIRPDWGERLRLRARLLKRVSQLVLMQFEEFWVERRAEEPLQRQFDRAETTLISSLFLTTATAGAAVASVYASPFLASDGQTLVIANQPRFWLAVSFFAASVVLAGVWVSERNAYRRLVRDRIPLLLVIRESFSSEMWRERIKILEAETEGFDAAEKTRLLSGARRQLVLTKRGEIDMDWIKKMATQEIEKTPDYKSAQASAEFAKNFENLRRKQQDSLELPLWELGLPLTVIVAITVSTTPGLAVMLVDFLDEPWVAGVVLVALTLITMALSPLSDLFVGWWPGRNEGIDKKDGLLREEHPEASPSKEEGARGSGDGDGLTNRKE